MSVASLQDLRRIAEAVGKMRGQTVQDVEVRTDCRSLRLTLADGHIFLVSVLADEDGKPRLDVDLLHPTDEVVPTGQLEVTFDPDHE